MEKDNKHATVIEGVTATGKPCRLVDNTGTVPHAELESLLAELIEQRRFGLSGRSSAGGSTIRLGEPDFTHIQLGDSLYRLILFPYEARIEVF